MSMTLSEVLEKAGYDFSTVKDAEWLTGREEEFDELVEKAEEVIELSHECKHEYTTTETQENTDEYELNQASGNTNFALTQKDIIVCDDCGAIQNADGSW